MDAQLTASVRSDHGVALERKILDRSAKIGVLGLGYVGLSLIVEMAKHGFSTIGIDIDGSRVDSVNAGTSYVLDVGEASLRSATTDGSIRATQSFAAVETLDAVSICVSTPLSGTKDPDLSYVVAATEAVRNHLTPGKLIVLESTMYPGTTREVVLPILRKSGLEVGRDFFLAYSPERVDPGNKLFTTHNTPKVIGGITARCTEIASLLYTQFIERVVPMPSPESAEMVKLLENAFRSVNIALANEIAKVCQKMNVNVWEVIDAATTKPFGFMPFYPGPGMGGPCLLLDPDYFTWKSKLNDLEPRLIEIASIINSQMPGFTVGRIADSLNKRKKSLNGSRILAVGVSYKSNVNDARGSAAVEVVKLLMREGANVFYCDPYISELKIEDKTLASVSLSTQLLKGIDCVVILTDHSAFDYSMIAAGAAVVLDCRNCLKNFSGSNILPL